jgi:DNA helicase IV
LEFDNVFLLDTKLLRLDQQQERNLKYVMQTRAKAFLGYIDSDNFTE